MSKEFKMIKKNKKSIRYENEEYIVTLEDGGYVVKRNDMLKPWYNDEIEEGEYFDAYCEKMTVKNKKTGKKATKRVYQDDPIQDLEDDLDSKIIFRDIFKKIDN